MLFAMTSITKTMTATLRFRTHSDRTENGRPVNRETRLMVPIRPCGVKDRSDSRRRYERKSYGATRNRRGCGVSQSVWRSISAACGEGFVLTTICRSSVLIALALAAACSPRASGDSAPLGGPTPAVYSVAEFYKNTQFFGASWSFDHKRLLVSSDLSGIWNAYVVPAAGGAPQPLTQSAKNSVFAVSYFPADDRILYSSDEGGNELSHLYVRNPDGYDQRPHTRQAS